MKPVKRSDHNKTFIGERQEGDAVVLPGVGDLSVKIHTGDLGPIVTSHWRPSEEELAVLNAGGVVEVDLYTPRIPPVAINVAPAEPAEKPGPPQPPDHGKATRHG